MLFAVTPSFEAMPHNKALVMRGFHGGSKRVMTCCMEILVEMERSAAYANDQAQWFPDDSPRPDASGSCRHDRPPRYVRLAVIGSGGQAIR